MLGTACGHCERCDEERAKMSEYKIMGSVGSSAAASGVHLTAEEAAALRRALVEHHVTADLGTKDAVHIMSLWQKLTAAS
jgi:hypothetical protein